MLDRRDLRDGTWLLWAAEFLQPTEADQFLEEIRAGAEWQQEIGYGRPYPRLTAWCADEGIDYRYSGILHEGKGWKPACLLTIRDRVQQATEVVFNSLLLNFYRTGQDSMGYHADDEPELGRDPVIASVSLGATRRFLLRHNTTGERISLELSHGSLLVMGGTCQHYYRHSIPKTRQVVGERINLTFRWIAPPAQGVRVGTQ